MKSIQRYDIVANRRAWGTEAERIPHPAGEFILYADHVRELASLREAAQKTLEWAENLQTLGANLGTAERGDEDETLDELRAALQSGKEE